MRQIGVVFLLGSALYLTTGGLQRAFLDNSHNLLVFKNRHFRGIYIDIEVL